MRRFAGLLLAVLMACQRERPKPSLLVPSASAKSGTLALPSAKSVERDETTDSRVPRAAATASAVLLDDVGPAGPATATAQGVVMLSRERQVLTLQLPKQPKASFEPVVLDAGAFSPFGLGPAVVGEHAYFISSGRLFRKGLAGSAEETLAADARDGTRVSAGSVGSVTAVAYVARAEGPGSDATARLWAGRETLRLSPEGAAASSVTLVETRQGMVALTLEGRTGMTPVHARRVLERDGQLTLESDVVVWIGGSAQAQTEVFGGLSPQGELWAFVAIERDATGFGLASLQVGEKPRMGVPVLWRRYPNGIDPAPVATASACGATWIAHARPAVAQPRSPQELYLSPLGNEGLGPPLLVASARAFANVSLAAAGAGLLVVYTADHRTWAARLDCPTR